MLWRNNGLKSGVDTWWTTAAVLTGILTMAFGMFALVVAIPKVMTAFDADVNGIQCGALLGGAVVIETVFNWPGMGRLAVESIRSGDFPVVQAVFLVFAGVVILVKLAADIGAAVIDPRLRCA